MAELRRVYRRELAERIGWKPSWFRVQRNLGRIPPGHLDPGGKKEWWLSTEVDEIIIALTRAAEPAPAPGAAKQFGSAKVEAA